MCRAPLTHHVLLYTKHWNCIPYYIYYHVCLLSQRWYRLWCGQLRSREVCRWSVSNNADVCTASDVVYSIYIYTYIYIFIHNLYIHIYLYTIIYNYIYIRQMWQSACVGVFTYVIYIAFVCVCRSTHAHTYTYTHTHNTYVLCGKRQIYTSGK